MLKREDKEVVSYIMEHLQGFGGRAAQRGGGESDRENPTAYDVHLSDGTRLTADFVLNAAGRPPQLEGLGLEKSGAQYSETGVKVTEYLRNPDNPRIFAAGDAHGTKQLSPVAGYEGDFVAHNFLNGDSKRAEYDAIPRVEFTVPPLASVGITQEQARSQEIDIDATKKDMSEWTVFRIAGQKPAYGIVIGEKKSGSILGAHLFGPGADEHIHVFAMAMRYGITRERRREMIYAYPALGSAPLYLTPSTGRMD